MQRKATYRMYLNASEAAAAENALGLHCRVTNALLEEHRRRYEAGEGRFGFHEMCKAITQWREVSPELRALSAQSLQVTAKRVALAFDAFFRRIAEGQTPGYPRFKSFDRFTGFGFKAHANGWKLLTKTTQVKRGKVRSHSFRAVRLSGLGTIGLRGRARFDGTPQTAEVLRKGAPGHEKWYLSVTFDVTKESVARKSGSESTAFDWGLTTLLTQVVGDPMTGAVEEIQNPRWLKSQLERLTKVQRDVSALEELTKKKSGKAVGFPVSVQLRSGYSRVRAIHSKVARQRGDFYHKLTAALVARFGFIVTEELSVKNMSRAPRAKPDPDKPGEFLPNGAASKAALNRSILDGAPASLIAKLRSKAEEAGSKFLLVPTRALKPTQRCHICGDTTKLELKERKWTCTCGARHNRDENAPRTMLRYANEGAWWKAEPRGRNCPGGMTNAARNSTQTCLDGVVHQPVYKGLRTDLDTFRATLSQVRRIKLKGSAGSQDSDDAPDSESADVAPPAASVAAEPARRRMRA